MSEQDQAAPEPEPAPEMEDPPDTSWTFSEIVRKGDDPDLEYR